MLRINEGMSCAENQVQHHIRVDTLDKLAARHAAIPNLSDNLAAKIDLMRTYPVTFLRSCQVALIVLHTLSQRSSTATNR